MKKTILSAGTAALALTLAACGNDTNENTTNTENAGNGGNENVEMNDNTGNNNADNEAENTNDPDMNAENNNAEADADMNEDNEAADNEASGEWYEDLDFDEFELDAEYGDGEYEVEYEYNDGNPEAEIEDSRDGEEIEMEGQEALDELEGPLTEMDVTADSSEEEILDAAIAAFDLEEDYDELEVEIEFLDDEETEAEDE